MVRMIIKSSTGVDRYCMSMRLGKRAYGVDGHDKQNPTRIVYDVSNFTPEERKEIRNDIIHSFHYGVVIDIVE